MWELPAPNYRHSIQAQTAITIPLLQEDVYLGLSRQSVTGNADPTAVSVNAHTSHGINLFVPFHLLNVG